MKVFITGATGFVGTHLVKRLARTKHELRCLVRKSSRALDLQATLIVGDVTDRYSLREGMAGCDWVINLANLYSLWEPDRRVYTAVNVEGTRNVMECALEAGVSKVVHISTAGIFGKPSDCPFTEESAVGPIRFSEYTRTKYAGDLLAWDLYEKQNLPLVMIYPGSILGPGDDKATGKYIQDVVYRRLPMGAFDDSVFTFVHVRDVAEAIVRAAEKEGNRGEKYLIGGHRLSWREFTVAIAEIAGVPAPSVHLPDPLIFAGAAIVTRIADAIKRPPLWGVSTDSMRMTRAGFQFDGSKATRELGITYTPIRVALEEAIAALR